jgi:tRNA(Ile2) C34 agmatinyltransferase TiaS
MKSKLPIHESPANYRTPHCPRCDTILEAHINQGQLIGWDCLACGKAIKIERAVKGRE